MEAYDAAVLSYALASAAFKEKPTGLVGLPSMPHDSLTPPRDPSEDVDGRSYLYQLLYNVEQMLVNRSVVQLTHLMEICSTKHSQNDVQISAHLDALLNELRKICKHFPGSIHLLQLQYDEDHVGVSLNSEIVCKTLSELLRLFGLGKGSSVVKKLKTSSS